MNPLTLTFRDPVLESAWWRDWAARSVDRQRVAVAALLAVVLGFGAVDFVAYPDFYRSLWTIRAAALLALAPALPAFAGPVERLARYGQLALLWCSAVTFSALFPVAAVMLGSASSAQLLLAIPSMILALLALFGASGLRFSWAAPVGAIVVAGFVAGWSTGAAADTRYSLLAASGTGGALVVGLLVSWSRESHARADFLQRREIEGEKARTERLLRVLMPDALARRLAESPGPHLVRGEGTVLFATVVGFDPARGSPLDAVALLDRVVGRLDGAAVAAGVERIKTIGPTLLFATGVPEADPDHVRRAARFALQLRALVAELGEEEETPLRARVGLATGPLVHGVVGRTRYAFDVWGDTVNTASRLESHGEVGRIQVPHPTAMDLSDRFVVTARGEIEVKGKGRLATAWLEAER